MLDWKNIDPKTPIKIYVLIDPRDNSVRYVGWTSVKLNERLSDHLSDARMGKRTIGVIG